MSFTVPKKTLLDEVIDPEVISELPGHRQFFDDNAALREYCHENAEVSNQRKVWGKTKGGWIHIGRIPLGVWAQLVRRDPYFLQDKAKVYKLLNEYKDYKIGGWQKIG